MTYKIHYLEPRLTINYIQKIGFTEIKARHKKTRINKQSVINSRMK
jgi:hypothetical protein